MRLYHCGTPNQYCNGRSVICDMNVRSKIIKVHSSPEDAFNCYAKYLVKELNYKRVGNREFKKSDDSPILVLTKKSRFGAHFRPGKSAEGSSGRGKRVTPYGKLTGGWIGSY